MFGKNSITSTVKKVMPAVVSIVVTKKLKELEKEIKKGENFPKDFSIKDIPDNKIDGEGNVEVGGGSGFIVNKEGVILTNRHVVSDSNVEYSVVLSDGNEFNAQVIARDPLDDIAILKIDPKGKNLPVVSMSKSNKIELGQEVLSFGNVLGVFQNTVSHGIVSGLSRSIRAKIEPNSSTLEMRGLIQTDAAINPGNSGGPLTNIRGKVVGINVAVVSGAQNIGFAIPVKIVKRDLEELQKYGKIKRPFFGVRYLTLNKDNHQKLGQSMDYGALVIKDHSFDKAVVSNSPADKAGIREGDIITKWNGEILNNKKDIQDHLSGHEVGDEIQIEFISNGESRKETVKLVERK